MTNNKIGNFNELNSKENLKEIKEIKIKFKKFSDKQLVIEDYSKLESLQLLKVNSIDKIILKNLTRLQECTIQGCSVVELVIENCPQIKTLNVRNNSLTSLDFLANLDSLEELELDGNTKLSEILKPYKGDWKDYQKDLQEIFELTKQNNFQGLIKKFWDLKKSREDLKKNVSLISKAAIQQKTTSRIINTKELVLNLEKKFEDKETEINRLELNISCLEFRVWELTELNERQGEKIRAYLTNFGSEEEMLRKLIKTYLEFVKFENQGTASSDYRKKVKEYRKCYEDIEEELENKLGEEDMNEVQRILTNCRKLFEQDLEAKTKLEDKSKLIEKQKQNLVSQTDDSKEMLKEQEKTNQEQRERRKSLLIAKLEGKLEVYRSLTPIPENQDESLIGRLIGELKEKSTLTSEEQAIISKVKELLGAKRIFLNTRQITIKGLQNCYNKLKGNKKYDKAGEVGSVISAGGTVAESLTFGVPKAFGEAIIAINNSFKKRFSDKRIEEFKELLINDEDDLSILEDIIVNNKNSETRLFSNKYEIFEIDHSIWRDKPFVTAEEMDAVIILLNKNFEELKTELDQEEKQFKRFLDDQNKNQQSQIQVPAQLFNK